MTKDKASFEAFLCFLSYNGNLTISAEHAGLSVSTIRRHRRADPIFAEAVKDALDAAADRLRVEAAAKSEESWTAFMAGESQTGWKDEAWTLCFIFVILACFIPSAQPYIERGFHVLDNTPDWFRWAMLASISASFGLRGFDRFLGRKGFGK